jgi:hypothetical protein
MGNNYLVVDGIINTGTNSVTNISLSRSRNLNDSTYAVLPENGAIIDIQSSAGNSYQLKQVSDGQYISDTLSLDIGETYRLHIITANHDEYLSDLVPVKQSPLIDSITWQQNNGITIYADTHDPANNTHYYRWDYIETWQHDASYEISWGLNNDTIIPVDPTTYSTYTYHCWTTNNSTNIVLATSAALTQDVISKAPIANIPNNSDEIRIRYSILVRQYALTPEAYQYWSIIQKNTQNIGTLFDLQPSQLHGNIASVNNKNEPVIGFISAGSVQQKRIFIDHLDLVNWQPSPIQLYCPVKSIEKNPGNVFLWTYSDTSYAPYYFVSGGGLNITKKVCLDCRDQGGTNIKPAFWQ